MPSPSTLQPDDKVLHEGKCYTIIAISSWTDLVHGRVYAFGL